MEWLAVKAGGGRLAGRRGLGAGGRTTPPQGIGDCECRGPSRYVPVWRCVQECTGIASECNVHNYSRAHFFSIYKSLAVKADGRQLKLTWRVVLAFVFAGASVDAIITGIHPIFHLWHSLGQFGHRSHVEYRDTRAKCLMWCDGTTKQPSSKGYT